ncbi:MAG: ribose-phosphate pyrophosphokinase [Bacteroidota bacterium]|jgi:ribose-phosphate pyrophosphokinase|nr:ribose-phosphate pyrophosphokinase [Flammeovirgaceae bacterium]MEC7260761.1 ribose-phosphate pyrophosphokinase [Bacteroidota bacterium]MEC8222162.1 ribose-phosphate pyrophosphokinase [Bacteroidota bacterium]|tara:strand:+ start:542 stop:1474 length:933 start_codon:yes stop_codon:yes gene_type:complete
MSTVKIFSGSGSEEVAKKIANEFGKPLGKGKLGKFSDGELSFRYTETVRGSDVYIVQSTVNGSDNLIELFLMIDAAKRASAKHVNVVIPYYGYARQDRKDKPRIAVSAKLMANLLTASGASRVVSCDLHAGQIQGFFDIPLDHLNGSSVFVPYVKKLNLENVIFASPDAGGTERVRDYAKYFDCEFVICDKTREKANEVKSVEVIGEVKDKDVIIVDDLIDTGGTIAMASNVIMDKGAKSVRAIITHPVLSGNAEENLENSSLIELVVTDSIPLNIRNKKIKVLSIAGLFAKAIRKIHENESTSSLFINR